MSCNVCIHIYTPKETKQCKYSIQNHQCIHLDTQTERSELQTLCTALIDSQYLQLLYCIPTSSGIPEFPQSYMISEFHVRKRQCLGFFIRHCKAPTKKTRRRDLYSDWIWITGIKPERFQDTSSSIRFERFSGFACPLELNHRCNSLS